MPFDTTEFLNLGARRIAYRRTDGEKGRTGIVWCGGLRSDMQGGKATALHAMAEEEGRPFLRFDYTGHGESNFQFEETTITNWREDAIDAIDHLTDGPLVLVGSSMGGWTSLLATLARPERVRGLVLIAPAPDFTERLMWRSEFTDEIRNEIETKGFWMRPSEYEEPYAITKALIEEGRNHLVTDKPIDLGGIPVRILQGLQDDAVPWRYALELAEKITSEDLRFTLIKDGDHRLSRDQDIDLIIAEALELADLIDVAA